MNVREREREREKERERCSANTVPLHPKEFSQSSSFSTNKFLLTHILTCTYTYWSTHSLNVSLLQEYEWTTKELRSALKSIEWDLEDLAETVTVVESTPNKFRVSEK